MTTGPTRTETTLAVSSPAFDDAQGVPVKYTCDAQDVSPPLRVSGVPEDAQALAIIMDDPDAPGGTFVHWLAWDLPATTREVAEGADIAGLGGSEGRNDFGRDGYGGPCPPLGSRHRYRFHVYALSGPLRIDAGSSRRKLEDAMGGKVLARGVLLGTYKRG